MFSNIHIVTNLSDSTHNLINPKYNEIFTPAEIIEACCNNYLDYKSAIKALDRKI